MKTIYNWQTQPLPAKKNNTIFTIGSFDGLHRGHQKIIKQIVRKAEKLNCNSLVLTFDIHPMELLYPSATPELLTTINTKKNILEKLGVKTFGIINFNEQLAKLSPQLFLTEIIQKYINPIEFISGPDFTFGFNAEGNMEYLKKWGLKYNVKITTIKKVANLKNGLYSSSQIRANLKSGLIKAANLGLHRLYKISGIVLKGFQKGRELGFPTANLMSIPQLIPAPGVYACFTIVEGKKYQSVTSIGNNPTFSRKFLTVENNIFDFEKEIYGQNISIYFVQKIRKPIKFKSVEALIAQMNKDKILTLKILTQTNKYISNFLNSNIENEPFS